MPINPTTQKHCNDMLQQSNEVLPFSGAFKDFVRKLLPEYNDLIAALDSNDKSKVIGYLTSAYHSLKWTLANPDHVIEMLENDDAGQLLVESYTMRAIGILQLRCLEAR